MKLMQDLKPGKAPGSDGIQKRDLMIDLKRAAASLTILSKKSLEHTASRVENNKCDTRPQIRQY